MTRDIKIVFMGTPDFAVPSLEILLDAGYPIAGVITAPDKPGGRGMKQLMISPVKSFALQHKLPVLQPTNLKDQKFINALKEMKADLQVVVAFRMLPEIVWNMPHLGTMNLHGSLLPAYRGAAPLQWAIVNGEKITGLTTFMLSQQIDTGKIISQLKIPILPEDDAQNLHDRMSYAGAGLVLGSVDLLAAGNVSLQSQDETKVSYAPKIQHDDAHIHWSQPVEKVHNHVRGMAPYPGAWTLLDGMEWKILKSKIFSNTQLHEIGNLRSENRKLIAQAAQGELELLEVQLAGKRRMKAAEFLNGYKIKDWSMT